MLVVSTESEHSMAWSLERALDGNWMEIKMHKSNRVFCCWGFEFDIYIHNQLPMFNQMALFSIPSLLLFSAPLAPQRRCWGF